MKCVSEVPSEAFHHGGLMLPPNQIATQIAAGGTTPALIRESALPADGARAGASGARHH